MASILINFLLKDCKEFFIDDFYKLSKNEKSQKEKSYAF